MPDIGGVPIFVPLLIVAVVVVGRLVGTLVSRVFGIPNEPTYWMDDWESGTGCGND